ncbi:hypothetical protein Tco_1084781, partial [Tanacetum coccineum]
TKEKVKTLALKAKITKDQTSDDSDSLILRTSARVIGLDAEINLVMMVIDSVKATVIALETKVVKDQNKRELATIAE